MPTTPCWPITNASPWSALILASIAIDAPACQPVRPKTAGGHAPGGMITPHRGAKSETRRSCAQIGKNMRLRARRQVIDVVEAVFVGDDQYQEGRSSQDSEVEKR